MKRASSGEPSRSPIHLPPTHVAPSFNAPPGRPADRLEVLRQAFAERMKDRDFLILAEKSGLAVDAIVEA